MIKRISLCLLFTLLFVPLSLGEDVSDAQKKAIIKEATEEIKAEVKEATQEAAKEASEEATKEIKAATEEIKEAAKEATKDVQAESVQKVAEEIAEGVKEAQTVQKGMQVTRPQKYQGPTQVEVTLYVLDIDNVATADQNFEANLFYAFSWMDSRLAGLYPDKVRKPLGDVWNPNIQFINQQRLWTTFPEVVEIYPSGKVVYKQRAWGSFSQPLDLKNFPFDKQSLNIQLVSAGYGPLEVEFIPGKGQMSSGIADKFSVADWKVTGWEVGLTSGMLGENRQQQKFYSMNIKVSRAYGYFLMQIIVPLIFIVFMSWCVFWIDPTQSGTQISVATTAMLTLIAFRFMAGITLPRIDYLTQLDYFILSATVLVFLALVEVVISSWLVRKKKLKVARNLDRVSRWFFPLAFTLAIVQTILMKIIFQT